MNVPRYCDNSCGRTVRFLENKIEGDTVTHIFECDFCKQQYAEVETVTQWKSE